jgi:predicted ATP-grasp superfamily ATP-dependent carboligase
VQGVRDLRNRSSVFQGTQILIPETIFPGDPLPKKGHWLIKDERHSGGLGVRKWDGVSHIHKHEMLQKLISGELMSVCFVADGRRSRLLGISRQYAGVAGLGAPSFYWCGNVAPYQDALLKKTISRAVERLIDRTGLIGVNGIDFIIHDDQIFFLEVNPRWTGSMELFEHLYGINMFQLHVDAFKGRLPSGQFRIKSNPVWGKGILYAKEDIQLGDTSAWVGQGIADIPHPGETIPASAPVCTLFAQAENISDCWKEVLNKAKTLQKEIYSRK